MDKTLIYTGVKSARIFRCTDNQLYLELGDYFEPILLKPSLLQLLPQLQLSLSDLRNNICNDNYSIEDILPFNELTDFLIMDNKSSYWLTLLCNLLLDEQLDFSLSPETIRHLRDAKWLPQKELHLVWKLLSKMRRLNGIF